MTDALTTFPATLDARWAELTAAREAFLAELGETNVHPPEGKKAWSAAELAYHLYIVEKQVTAGLKQTLKASARGERKSDAELQEEWGMLAKFIANREMKIEAPAPALPVDAPELAESLNLLKESRAALKTLLDQTNLDEMASIGVPHPLGIGVFTGVGWLTLLSRHELRHTDQLKELKASVNQ